MITPVEPLVQIIADSISPNGVRLTTATVRMHRFILPEWNTHRQFSRNAASNRARPFKSILEEIRNDIALPYKFGTNKPGMQSGDPLKGSELAEAQQIWVDSFDAVCVYALKLYDLNVHKEVINRLLEPYMWQTVLVSATSFDNFFNLRCSDLAQREIEVPAQALRHALRMTSAFTDEVGYGGWHLPFITDRDREWFGLEYLRRMSAARCARVSFMTHDNEVDYAKDLNLFDMLFSPAEGQMHSSPFEHVATPSEDLFVPGNFDGWTQWRHLLEAKKK